MNYYIRKIGYSIFKYIHLIKNKHLIIGHNTEIKFNSKFEGYNKILANSHFDGELGYASYIGENSIIIGKIGKYCSIAGNVVFLTKTHPVKDFVSTHPAFYSIKKQSGFTYVKHQLFDEEPKIPKEKYSIIVGNDVYIGHGVTIVGPVKISDGAVIAANSTVTHDVLPYSIVGGNPAKVIKKRFSDEEIKFLLKFKWWEKDPVWLQENVEKFSSLNNLKNIKEEYKL